MKKFCLLLGFLMAAAISGCQSAPSIDSIISDMHKASLDERKAPKKIESAIVVLSDTDDNSTITLRYLAPDKFRFESIGDNTAELYILDGKNGYAYTSESGLVKLNSKEIKELAGMIKIQPFDMKLTDIMSEIRVKGSARVAGENCWIIDGKSKFSKDGKGITVYVGKKNKLIRKIVNADLTPATEVTFFDYKDFDGIKLPETAIESTDGKISKRKLLDAKWNVPIPANSFEPPARFQQR